MNKYLNMNILPLKKEILLKNTILKWSCFTMFKPRKKKKSVLSPGPINKRLNGANPLNLTGREQ